MLVVRVMCWVRVVSGVSESWIFGKIIVNFGGKRRMDIVLARNTTSTTTATAADAADGHPPSIVRLSPPSYLEPTITVVAINASERERLATIDVL